MAKSSREFRKRSSPEVSWSVSEAAAEERIKQKPLEVIAAAKHGSFQDLLALTIHPIPSNVRSQAFDAFCSHIKQPCSEDPEKDAIPFLCLGGISNLARLNLYTPLSEFQLMNLWPDLFRWMLFMYEAETFENYDGDEDTTLLTLNGVVQYIYSQGGAKAIFMGNAQAVELVVKLWLRRCSIYERDPQADPTHILGVCMTWHESLRDLVKETLLKLSDADSVAAIALSRLRRDAALGDVHRVREHVGIFCGFSIPVGHPIQKAIVDADGLPTVIRVARRLAGRILNREFDKSTCLKVVSALLESVCSILNSVQNSAPRWAQAVKHGLLKLLLKVGLFSKELGGDVVLACRELLSTRLPEFLVFRSVLHEVTKSFEDMSVEDYRLNIRSSLFFSAWRTLENALVEKCCLKVLHDREYKEEMIQCEGVDCVTTDKRIKLKKCAGCNMVWYCSPECQRTAWVNGQHKTTCKTLQEVPSDNTVNDDGEALATERDHRFLTRNALADVRRHLPKLRSIYETNDVDNMLSDDDAMLSDNGDTCSDEDNKPFEKLVFVVNYSRTPPHIELQGEDEMEDYQLYKHVCRENEGGNLRMIALTVAYPTGASCGLIDRAGPVENMKDKIRIRSYMCKKRESCLFDDDESTLESLVDEVDIIISRVKHVYAQEEQTAYPWDSRIVMQAVDDFLCTYK